MSRIPPAYFEPIRKKADDLWVLLENNPDLMAPWVHLFRQVQSPRHVLSELMQNADDVGAKNAVVSMEDGYFSFMHDGEDFNEANFQSICRFGYSNKREMHTIGFRGIGFKSTFSLGQEVLLLTPSLSVSFHSNRFIVPLWNNEVPRRTGWTEIRIKVTDRLRFDEFKKNLDDWLKTGFSLLFFRNIRSLRIGVREITWLERSAGPIPQTQWMTVKGSDKGGYLVARSGKLAFPPECQDEIRKERQVFDSDQIQMPPCTVEIIAGAKGRLHVIVPTSVETNLPFTINAPFVQDPARIKIKELELSPTNRWLLEQVGVLVANLILEWICNSSDSVEKRAQAYSLLPVNNTEDLDDLPVRVLRLVDQELMRQLEEKNFLLDVHGSVHPPGKCFTVDSVIQNIWPSAVVTTTFGPEGANLLNNAVTNADRQNLAAKGYVTNIAKKDVLHRLKSGGIPKPHAFSQLVRLWNHVVPELSAGPESTKRADFHILPVLNSNQMAPARDTLRIHRTNELGTPEDWDFFGNHLKILDSTWVEYLSSQPDPNDAGEEGNTIEQRDSANKLLEILGLGNHVGLPRLLKLAALKLKEEPRNQLENCVRLTHIAAKLNESLPEDFLFFNQLKSPCQASWIVNDRDGFIQEYFPESISRAVLPHASYHNPSPSCTQQEWLNWMNGPKSGFLTFPLPPTIKREIAGRESLESMLAVRQYSKEVPNPYQRQLFEFGDKDYLPEAWAYWDEIAQGDPTFWKKWSARFFLTISDHLKKVMNADVWQIWTLVVKKKIINDLSPGWVLQLKQRKWLQDDLGNLESPEKLLLHGPKTKVFEGFLRFVSEEIDTGKNRPILEMLGAKSGCSDPDPFLNSLRALSKAETPPLGEVLRLYRMLDALIQTTGFNVQSLIDVFKLESLIFTTHGEWVNGLDPRAGLGKAPSVPEEIRLLELWPLVIQGKEPPPPPPPPPPTEPVYEEEQPFPFGAFNHLPKWLHVLFPIGSKFKKYEWRDGSITVQLNDEQGNSIVSKHIPADQRVLELDELLGGPD